MGGPVEKLIDGTMEKALKIFGIDHDEAKVASIHFLTHFFFTTVLFYLATLGASKWWMILPCSSLVLVFVAEMKDGRNIDRVFRGLGWLAGSLPILWVFH